ncbi:hypothetical protein NIES806_06560 [Dolichospermum compactum NIES-806]|uniref:Uncharacterized protein n=1 Tax=Dolichospermum compactum NIES-806 TaxID=1973481 RepID=A0A1Z4UYY7_9CYAN|nr:hypothetical protein NIES806_06560 [Dolichospermum compactum NIES-806]
MTSKDLYPTKSVNKVVKNIIIILSYGGLNNLALINCRIGGGLD